jgi:mannose-6-phosphate isomerase-like protein (cupin superfamily)
MSYSVVRAEELPFERRDGYEGDERTVAALSELLGFKHSRANVWNLPPGNHGKRHRDLVQEETFVVLRGTLTMYLGEPSERVELPQGSVVLVQPGTALQLRNEGDEDATVYAYGAPPERGQGEFLDDAF